MSAAELMKEYKQKIKELKAKNEYRKARLNAGLTLDKTSGITGVPVQTICSWESGKCKPPAYVRRWYLQELEGLSK